MTPSLLSAVRQLGDPRSFFQPVRRPETTKFVINPVYADLLRRSALHRPHDFLRLREEVLSGHPDRQVSRVTLACGVTAYLKREHQVPWKVRARNWWDGFEFASKSWREMLLLQRLQSHFDGCPDWLAAGETEDARAFLLLAEVPQTVPLPQALETINRQDVARQLGHSLAQLHNAGFVHSDLYANHVLIEPTTGRVVFLDWQRAMPSRRQTWRDLATLSATLPENLASCGDRLTCLEAYHERAKNLAVSLEQSAWIIEREARRLKAHRHIRAKARPMHLVANQRLFNLEGEALQVTVRFREIWAREVPDFLKEHQEERRLLALPDGSFARLVRTHYRPVSFRWTSPERLQMSLLNRLERFGLEVPRVLAVGERSLSGDSVAAFLLTRLPDAAPLTDWLERNPTGPARANVLREVGVLLARLHETGCFFRETMEGLAVTEKELRPRVALMDGAELVLRRRWRAWWRRRDLARLGWLPYEDRQHVYSSYRRSRSTGEVGA